MHRVDPCNCMLLKLNLIHPAPFWNSPDV
uniref:Uncharacterized protein n=1 Tax=Arundo donax TaxID=35708 RepID=A0A0A9D5S9_ARUDO